MSDFIEDEFDLKAEEYPTLGPEWFAARAAAERHMKHFEAEHFQPLIDEFGKQFADRLWGDVASSLIADTEWNIAGEIRSRVQRNISALLSGDEHYIRQYVLSEYADFGEQIREAIANKIPKEIQDARIADLEKENKQLRESLEWARR